jgi:hypothetical protein
MNGLPLALLKARVFLINNVELSFPSDDLAIDRTLFDGGFYFHDYSDLEQKEECMLIITCNDR